MNFIQLLQLLDKHFYIKNILIILFVIWQYMLLSLLYNHSHILFYLYLICFLIAVPFLISFVLIITCDFSKKKPNLFNMTNEQLLKRYRFSRFYKFSYSNKRHIFIKTIDNPKSEYNYIGKFCNAIILSYFEYNISLILLGIILNWLMLMYFFIGVICNIYQKYKNNIIKLH